MNGKKVNKVTAPKRLIKSGYMAALIKCSRDHMRKLEEEQEKAEAKKSYRAT